MSITAPADPAAPTRAQRREHERMARVQAELRARGGAEISLDEAPARRVGALRTWGDLRAGGMWGPPDPRRPHHRATALRYGVAVPFLAESGLGASGAIMGKDLYSGGLFAFDPWEAQRAGIVTGVSMVCIGLQGVGKSSTNKALACRLIALGRKVAITSDPKGEWARVARAVGGKVIEIGPGRPNRLNPLDAGRRPGGLDDDQWHLVARTRRVQMIEAIVALLRDGDRISAAESRALTAAIDEISTSHEVPTVRHLHTALETPAQGTATDLIEAGRSLAHVVWQLLDGAQAGMFDQPSTVAFDDTAPMIVFDTSALTGDALSIASVCTAEWLEHVIRAEQKDFWLLVSEEGWSQVRNPYMLDKLDAQWRLAGEWGIANMLVMHELKDLDMVGPAGSPARERALGLLSKAHIKIIMRQAAESIDLTAEKLLLTARERDEVLRLGKGEALWKVGQDRSFKVRALLTADEFNVFQTDARRAG